MADRQTETLGNTAKGLATDMERLLRQHLGRLKEEMLDELGKATSAGASLGGGLGMTALGTILGGIGFVHLVQRITGLPLWLCYAGCSATACAAGAGLFAKGIEQAGELELLPEGTDHAARNVARHAAEHAAGTR